MEKKGLKANLTIRDTGYRYPRERDMVEKISGFTSEKDKGLMMIETIENRFSISTVDRDKWVKERLKEMNADAMTPTEYPKAFKPKPIKWKRDEKGNIVSPFRSKRKVFEKI